MRTQFEHTHNMRRGGEVIPVCLFPEKGGVAMRGGFYTKDEWHASDCTPRDWSGWTCERHAPPGTAERLVWRLCCEPHAQAIKVLAAKLGEKVDDGLEARLRARFGITATESHKQIAEGPKAVTLREVFSGVTVRGDYCCRSGRQSDFNGGASKDSGRGRGLTDHALNSATTKK